MTMPGFDVQEEPPIKTEAVGTLPEDERAAAKAERQTMLEEGAEKVAQLRQLHDEQNAPTIEAFSEASRQVVEAEAAGDFTAASAAKARLLRLHTQAQTQQRLAAAGLTPDAEAE